MTQTNISSFEAVVNLLGDKALVEGLGLTPQQPRDWRRRKSIPPEWWARVTKFAAENGHPEITLRLFSEIRQKISEKAA